MTQCLAPASCTSCSSCPFVLQMLAVGLVPTPRHLECYVLKLRYLDGPDLERDYPAKLSFLLLLFFFRPTTFI